MSEHSWGCSQRSNQTPVVGRVGRTWRRVSILERVGERKGELRRVGLAVRTSAWVVRRMEEPPLAEP